MIIVLSKVKYNTLKMKSLHYCLVVLGIMTLVGVSALSSSNLAFAEINTDKPTYAKGELLEVSGSLDLQTAETVNIIKIEITNLNDENNKIVDEYTPIDDNNTFSRSYETVTWEAGEYTVTIRYDQASESTEFEITDTSVFSTSDDDATGDETRSDDDTTGDETRSDDDTTGDETRSDDDTQHQSQSSSTIAPGSPVDPPTISTAPSTESNTLNNQILTLQSENQQLRDENNQLKAQVEDINKRIEQLGAIIKEQLRVMMETLAALKDDN